LPFGDENHRGPWKKCKPKEKISNFVKNARGEKEGNTGTRLILTDQWGPNSLKNKRRGTGDLRGTKG